MTIEHIIAQDKLLLFGDSITQGSSQQDIGDFNLQPGLQHYYLRTLDVVNRGFGGYNTEHGRYMIGPILEAETTNYAKVRLAVVFFGSNDGAINPDGSYRIKLERYKQNLRDIVAELHKAGAKVIVTGPAPFNIAQVDLPTDRDTRVFRKYAEAAGEVAAETGSGFVNLWERFMASVGWDGDLDKTLPGEQGYDGPIDMSHLFTDGLHYKSAGYEVWYAGITEQIAEHFPELLPEKLPRLLPEWDQIDIHNLPDDLFKKTA